MNGNCIIFQIKMRGYDKTVLFISLYLAITYASETHHDDWVKIEVDTDSIYKNVNKTQSRNENTQNARVLQQHAGNKLENGKATDYRNAKILWPYPVGQNKENDSYGVENRTQFTGKRQERLLWSYPQSPLVGMMLQSLPPNYTPMNPSDPFDFLRDTYPLPKGNYTKGNVL